ncbi:hypothetical protein DL96DRAFT_1591456 [Flagelloscypha sp. PMI_526]|nr:hypothetical protein DL96DRAFT_1591456 [Flagelloscypha sp. PMI_526]
MSTTSSECQLFEMIQYTCSFPTKHHGVPFTQCYPFARIFRQCGSDPAVEVTKIVQFDESTSSSSFQPSLPDNLQLPEGKAWKDVKTHDPWS